MRKGLTRTGVGSGIVLLSRSQWGFWKTKE
jgi:hypothetical protein